jgi:hypothetical protein
MGHCIGHLMATDDRRHRAQLFDALGWICYMCLLRESRILASVLFCVCIRLGYRVVRSARVSGDPGRGGRSWRALEMAGYSVVVIFTDAGGRVKYYVLH